MKKIREIQNKLSDSLKIPTDALGGASRLQWVGDSVSITACKRICGYTADKIAVQTADGILTVFGHSLKCLYFFESVVQIHGKIEKIEVLQND